MPDMYTENRDMRCAADVGRMAALGRFDVEFQVYGCAYLEKDKITYRVSPQAEALYAFQAQSADLGLYPTTIYSHIRRTPAPSGMRQQLESETKLELVRQLRQDYPRCYFDLLRPFTQTPANNSSFPLLSRFADVIDGHFQESELQLLEGLMRTASEAKLLSADGLAVLSQFLNKIRRQMADDPVIENRFSRTLYGFCYEDDTGRLKHTLDAQPLTIYQRHSQLELRGYLTAPIFHQTCWFSNFDEFPTLRRTFAHTLTELEGAACFQLLHKLRTLPSAIDTKAYRLALKQFPQDTSAQALADFRRYGRRLNALPFISYITP